MTRNRPSLTAVALLPAVVAFQRLVLRIGRIRRRILVEFDIFWRCGLGTALQFARLSFLLFALLDLLPLVVFQLLFLLVRLRLRLMKSFQPPFSVLEFLGKFVAAVLRTVLFVFPFIDFCSLAEDCLYFSLD